MDQEMLLTRKEAAAFLRLAPSTLRKWAMQGKGPRPRKIGTHRVLYSRRDLEEFAGLRDE